MYMVGFRKGVKTKYINVIEDVYAKIVTLVYNDNEND